MGFLVRTGESLARTSRTWSSPDLWTALGASLGRDLWEVRSSLTQGKIARLIFCVSDGQMVLLHAFIKKTQKTPQHEIDLALKRMTSSE